MGRKRKTVPGIYERGNKWVINTTYKGHRIWERCATPEMAEINLRKITTLIDERRYLDKKRQPKETLGQFAKQYLKWCQDIGQKAYTSKKQRINLIVRKLGKDVPLGKITRAEIERYQSERLSSPGDRKKIVKPATVNREIAALKHLLAKAVEWKILGDNPANGVGMLKETGRKLRFLTTDECHALLSACPSQTMKQVVTIALYTGMRRGEILGLKWDNVNLREEYIELTDQKNGERSTIDLNHDAVEVLRQIPKRIGCSYLFPGKTSDKPFYDLKRQFQKAVRDAKLEGVTFHTLRHTAASHLVMAGVDLPTVREILRHKSYEMTLRYSHLSKDHKKTAMNKLAGALNAKPEDSELTA